MIESAATDIQERPTVEGMFQAKLRFLSDIENLKGVDRKIREGLKRFGGYEPYRIEWRFENQLDNREERYVDRVLWIYLVKLYRLEKYMLCTEFEKMSREIDEFRTPDFTPENAYAWLDGLKGMIYENVRMMCKKVYESLVTGTYRVGDKWNNPKKKRNNNGVDSYFILPTNDYVRIFGYFFNKPTVTDDLEKVCYILDGKSLPDTPIIDRARFEQISELECPYFHIKFCKNGNTHYKLTDETRDRLNRIGPEGNVIGEDIKIKVFEKDRMYAD